MSKARKELDSSLSKLSLGSQNHRKISSSKKDEPVVDSWEDEDLSSGEETNRRITVQSSNDFPNAPPPTPISPTIPHGDWNGNSFISPFGDVWNQSSNGSSSPSPHNERGSATRPEKTDAVAKRLIAGALGVRAPKKTEEQRAYDRALRDKEMKRRNLEKESKLRADEEAARAKAAAWSD